MTWYKEWFGEDYLDLYAHRDQGEAQATVDFVVDHLATPVPRAVLDLACGAGRHTMALRKRGLRALGIDLSLTLLGRAAGLPRVAGDMCCLPFAAAAFDWVLNFFTSFGYFETERQNLQVLEEIGRVLRPGGRYLIDLFNVDHVLASLEPRERAELDGRQVEIERWYDPTSRRLNKRIRLEPQGKPARTYLESVRAYRQEEVESGLSRAGLEVTETLGSFNGDAFERDSERLIIIGRRPG